MDEKAKIGVAIVGGYLLGRTKKGKAALSLALWLGGSRLGLDPKTLVRESATRLANSPQVGQLGEQVRGPLADAGRKAAVATIESRMNQLADSLNEHTSALQGAAGGPGAGSEDESTSPDETGGESEGPPRGETADDQQTEQSRDQAEPEEQPEEQEPSSPGGARVPRQHTPNQESEDHTPDQAGRREVDRQ